jgi:putative membrane protein
MFRILAHVGLTIVTVLIIHEILPDEIYYDTTETLLIFAAILGVAHAFVLPILRAVTLPLTCLTLGLFAFVLSAAAFYIPSMFLEGIEVTYLGAAIAALLFGVLNGVLDSVLGGR